MAERWPIDEAGAVYVRLPEPEDVAGPVFQPVATVSEADEEGLW